MVYIYHHINSGEEEIGELQKNKLESVFNFKFTYIKNVIPLTKNEWDTFLLMYNSKELLKSDDIILFIKSNLDKNWKEILETEIIYNFNFYQEKIKGEFNTAGCSFSLPEYDKNFYGGIWLIRGDYLKSIELEKFEQKEDITESNFIQSGKNWNPFHNIMVNYTKYPFLLSHNLKQFSKKEII